MVWVLKMRLWNERSQKLEVSLWKKERVKVAFCVSKLWRNQT